ncbi:MAG: sulfite exporter TauE/SafE family protein [Kofleriaceae bacterium]|nr:sulfite exporter TauE/SafE family protein [Kofleriaceae bacterium]MCL4226201.1 sulfite exporter TauE/SafE family protein [Myxococcales bacterium]
MDPLSAAALAGAGLVAGGLNTLAGGGSLLLVPALMLVGAGMPADAANASSRVAILAQCAAGATTFARGGHLPTRAAWRIVPPVLAGAIAGAWFATRLPNRIFEPLLLGTLGLMALALLVNPRRFAPPPGSEPRRASGPLALAGLFAAGVYGGVLQAGAGLVFLAILAGGLRFDLVRANALKALVMLIYIAATVAVFAAAGLVAWEPAAWMSAGSVVGAWGAARLAMSARGVLVTKVVVVLAVLGMGVAIALR